ncbi:MAG: anaerobic ribonucleoside-triphosphate reductase activating protein [Rubrivivax sp.]|nr:anaerobic ribonucleoside-triphosphate reductase activating protein [Rubrivivax sp.]
MLELGGFTPLTTTDWPGKLAAVAFVQGCPWHCRYCHNPELQPRGVHHGPLWPEVLAMLARRVGLLDGLVFSGGEPTLEPDLAQAVDEVRALGLKVGLHTAGIYPERLAALLPALDWVGFDLKTDAAGYDALTTRRDSAAPVRRALDHLLASGVDHEIRTTYHPSIVGDEALVAMARQLKAIGATTWVLQRWQPFDEASADLVASWHWPLPALLEQLRSDIPALTLR